MLDVPVGQLGPTLNGAWAQGMQSIVEKQGMTIKFQARVINLLVMEVLRIKRMEEATYGPFE